MQMVENRDHFKQEVQQLLRKIDERMQDLSQTKGSDNQANTEEIKRLKNQRHNLQEALEHYGNKTGEDWKRVQAKAQQALDEVNNNWRTNTASDWNDTPHQDKDDKWRVSTGQSDRGNRGMTTGVGDKGGMEDRQFGLDNTTQYSSFGNPYDDDEVIEIEEDRHGHHSPKDRDQQSQGGAGDRNDQNNQGRTRRQGNPDDWKTHESKSGIQSSYEKMRATDRRENEPENKEGLSHTNIGGSATEDNPGGSPDKEKNPSVTPTKESERTDRNRSGKEHTRSRE